MKTAFKYAIIHQLQYPNQGQNYVFNGCMKLLMECIKEENQEYDYWFFSAVSGDCFVQVFNTNKWKWSTCFSQSKFDYQLIKRVFDSIGYEFIFLVPEEWQKDKTETKKKIIESIDKGIPIIAKGFNSIVSGLRLPTDEVSCIVGYDEHNFYRMTEETTDLIAFTLDDDLPYIFVFTGKKKKAPPIAQTYRKTLINACSLLRTPPSCNNEIHFGNDAFEEWAKALESDFYIMKRDEYESGNSIANWRYYCVYVCIISTNICSKKKIVEKAIQMNPDLSNLAPQINAEYEKLSQLEKELENSSGGFNITYEILQNAEKRREIAQILRKFPIIWNHICEIFQKIPSEA